MESNSHPSVENRLLLTAATSTPDSTRLRELVRIEPDWTTVVELAVAFGIAPLVYSNLQELGEHGAIPDEVLVRLQGLYLWHAVENGQLYVELQRILAAFASEDISVVVLKGAALAALVYGDVALRPMGDIDLLLEQSDLGAADRLMRSLGFDQSEAGGTKAWYEQHHHHVAPYVSKDRSIVVELHHHIARPTLDVSIPVVTLWERARPVEIASTPTLALGPEFLLLHAALHVFEKSSTSGKGMISRLVDIAEIVQHDDSAIDWVRLTEDAITFRTDRRMYYALWLARQLVNARVPDEVLTDLGSSARAGWIEDRCLKRLIRTAALRNNEETYFVPSWLVAEICTELLGRRGRVGKAMTLCGIVAQRLVDAARRRLGFERDGLD